MRQFMLVDQVTKLLNPLSLGKAYKSVSLDIEQQAPDPLLVE